MVAFTAARAAVKLPIEVVGAAGTEESVEITVPTGSVDGVTALRVVVHGLEYPDMASVRLNDAPWLPLNNGTVTVAEPGRSYGGIGGGFATLKLTLPVSEGTVKARGNILRFRFNGTNGVASGFRVLALNFLTRDGHAILPDDAFVDEDPSTWTPPLPDAANISAGRELWYSGALVANGLPNARPIRAHCADCHAKDGRDLKYFNFSNASIVARSRFHGLSELQGQQIASYIRSLALPNPGRPWNPPYQPGPGFDKLSAAERAAGAGLKWVLDDDAASLAWLFPGSVITPAAFRPDANLNAREIPIAFQLPDWNHWLPHVHPLDAWGERFENSTFAQEYRMPDRGDRWIRARDNFLASHAKPWTRDLAEQYYAAELWQLVKTWEIAQPTETWPNSIPAATAPAEVGIPDSPAGMGGSALTNEYFNNAWYQLQVLLNDGGHRHADRRPVDWIYLIGHVKDLQQLSGRPEAARLLTIAIKALQSTDPQAGPRNIAEGWRPERNIDPRIVVDEEWAPMFQALPRDVRKTIAESLLAAWLDKNMQYPASAYFALGLNAGAYMPPAALRNVSGGRAWEAAARFRAAGVSAQLVGRLEEWGRAYMNLAQLFHY